MSDAGYSKPNQKSIRKGEKARKVDKRFKKKSVAKDVPPSSFLRDKNAWRNGPVRARPRVEEMGKEMPVLRARNGMISTARAFTERHSYKHDAFEGILKKQLRDNLIDLWYDSPLYGKVDFEGIPVFPHEYHLKQFTSCRQAETIYGLGFVVDAFEDMVSFIAKRKVELVNNNFNMTRQESERLVPSCFKSWNSPRRAYEEYFSQLYALFHGTTLLRKRNKIFTFEDFMQHFYEFVDIITPDLPLTYTGWYTSYAAGHDHTGLMVEIFDMPYDKDFMKQQYFIESDHFKLVSSAAENFGFLIDKNVPWRLVANLNSPRMKSYMLNSGVPVTQGVKSSLFDVVYEKTFSYDIEFLRTALVKMWENFIEEEPFATVSYQCGRVNERSSVKVTKQKLIPRASTNAFGTDGFLRENSKYYTNYNDLHWLRLYYYVTANERNKIITISNLDSAMPGIYNEYKRNGIIAAMSKVNEELY